MRSLAVFFLLWGCGTQERSIPLATPTVNRQSHAVERTEVRANAERVARVAREIAALRGWNENLRIPFEWAENSRIRQAIVADLHAQTSPSELHAQTHFLEAFGWVPPDFDLEATITRNFSREIVGLYSLTGRRILLASDHRAASLDSVLRHELVHAFQDQYFQIGKRVRWAPNRGDEIAAIHALAEGEAICISRQLEDQQGCFSPGSESLEDRAFEIDLGQVPPIIRYALMAPYVDGVRYVRHLLQHGGWASVDEAWRKTLRSTRDLFHDEPERPRSVDIPPPVPGFGDCQALYVDQLGEQGLASVVFTQGEPNVARRLAAGLESDRAVYWRCERACAAAWRLRLRNAEAARTLAPALRRVTEIPIQLDDPSGACTRTLHNTLSFSQHLQDIVITSVHDCDNLDFDFATPSCQSLENWASRFTGH